jgi:hypothetical protein
MCGSIVQVQALKPEQAWYGMQAERTKDAELNKATASEQMYWHLNTGNGAPNSTLPAKPIDRGDMAKDCENILH